MKVKVTGITAKGRALLWVLRRTKNDTLADIAYRAMRRIPLRYFEMFARPQK